MTNRERALETTRGGWPRVIPTGPGNEDETLVRRIEQHFAKLATVGIQPDGSISRIAFSDEESAAMAYIRAEGESFGLTGTYDGIGNLVLSTPGDHAERFIIGSHIDSVPHGGNYDGAAGIVAGLEALNLLVSPEPPQKYGVDVAICRGEEYTFDAVYKGSAAAFGLSSPHILHNLHGDRSLRDAIRQQGFDPSYIDEGRPTFSQTRIDGIRGYFEMHIEQGVVLERENIDLGIVTSIAGDRRYQVVLEGRFDHSGATPMGAKYRGDVNLAMAYVQVRLDELAKAALAKGRVFTQTVGIVNSDPEMDKKYPQVHCNSVTKVSGLGYFTLDLMAADDEFLDDYAAELLRVIWSVSRELNVKAFIEQTDAAAGLATLDAGLQDQLEAGCKALQVSHRRIPSGAGHDAVMVGLAQRSDASRIPVAMLFIPCRGGISHSKEERAQPEHVANATRVLAHTLRTLTS